MNIKLKVINFEKLGNHLKIKMQINEEQQVIEMIK